MSAKRTAKAVSVATTLLLTKDTGDRSSSLLDGLFPSP
jgi:hypothetical protein